MEVASDECDLLVVTQGGYGKRTAMTEYPIKGRGTMGVQTIKLTDKKGGLAAALIVREGDELLFMSQGGMVQRTSAGEISQYKRASQGVRVMNIKDDDEVSAVAPVMEGSSEDKVVDEALPLQLTRRRPLISRSSPRTEPVAEAETESTEEAPEE